MRAYVPPAFVSLLVFETDNRTIIIDVVGAQISSTVLTSDKSSKAGSARSKLLRRGRQ